MLDAQLAADIRQAIKPDVWNPRWSEVGPAFGAGMAVELEIGELLHALVRAIKPEVVIETGGHKGFSALMIAEAIKENKRGHLWSIDKVDYDLRGLCAKYGVSEQVTFLRGHSPDMIKMLCGQVGKVDLLWLDADHSKESVLAEMRAAQPLLSKGTYIAFHDTVNYAEEGAAVRQVRTEHPDWEYMRIVSARGFDVMRLP